MAQCKFHGDLTAAVGARETDELPVALLKFGCKSGLFVTTARLSPQSKREYLNDFPGFELEFWDGLQLVDQVLSSPLLTELWFHGDSVQRRAVSVAVPFIIRRAGDDRPVRVDATPFSTPEYSVNFKRASVSSGVFAPYRPPKIVDSGESGGETIWCSEALITGTLDLRGLSPAFPRVVDAIAVCLPRGATHTTRLGRPSFVPLQRAEPSESEDGDRLLVHGESGRSFVVSPDGAVHDERDWVVPKAPACMFPRNLSVAEADWAGWYNADDDCMVMEEVSWPSADVPYPYQLIGAAREQFLGKSVFSLTAESQSADIRGSGIPEPDVAVQVSNGIVLVGWLHPALLEASPAFERDPHTGEMVMRPSADWESGEAALVRVRDTLSSLRIEETPLPPPLALQRRLARISLVFPTRLMLGPPSCTGTLTPWLHRSILPGVSCCMSRCGRSLRRQVRLKRRSPCGNRTSLMASLLLNLLNRGIARHRRPQDVAVASTVDSQHVLSDVKALRFAPTPPSGAGDLDAASARATEALTATAGTNRKQLSSTVVQNSALSDDC